jgi:hypothetical protein
MALRILLLGDEPFLQQFTGAVLRTLDRFIKAKIASSLTCKAVVCAMRSLSNRKLLLNLQVFIKPLHTPPDRINAILALFEAVAFVRIVVGIHGLAVRF